jgi:hypothetical protein
MVRNHKFDNAGATKPFQGLGRGIGLALLGRKERVSNVDPDRARERPQNLERRPHPPDGLSSTLALYTSIHILL